MTLSRMDSRTPFYIALSTDVVLGKIIGADYVGARVFITDTQLWYIVGSDLILTPYSEAISTGVITIGAVEGQGTSGSPVGGFLSVQGDTLGSPLPILYPPATYALLNAGSKLTLVSASEFHYHVHIGDLWSATSLVTGLASNATVNIGITTTTKSMHVGITHSASADGKIEWHIDAVYTGGTALPIMNHDISVVTSPTSTFALNPTISNTGTIKRTTYITGGSGGSRVGGVSPFSHEFIIPSASQVVLTFTNLNGNSVIYGFASDYYEV